MPAIPTTILFHVNGDQIFKHCKSQRDAKRTLKRYGLRNFEPVELVPTEMISQEDMT